MVKLIHKERIAEGSTRRFLDGRRNDAPLRPNRVAKFRESHHMLAKLFAVGLKGTEISVRTGYAENTISQFHNDPAFQELISKYRDLDTQLFLEGRDEFYSLATKNMIQAERQLSDKMDELDTEGEFLPTRELISVVADRADRFGYGKRETKFNVNVDFADALQRAIKRSGKTIEGQVSEGLGGMKTISSSELLAPPGVVPSVPQTGPSPSGAPGDQNGCPEKSGSPRYQQSPEWSPDSAERPLKSASHARPHVHQHQVDGVGDGYFGLTPQAEQSVVASPSPLVPRLGPSPMQGIGGRHTLQESGGEFGSASLGVEAPQRELVRPGAVEPRPLRRRLLG